MWNTLSLSSLPGPLSSGMVASDRVLSMGQIEQNCILMQNRIVLTFKLHIYAKLNSLKWNRFYMLNWIVWNRTVLILNWA